MARSEELLGLELLDLSLEDCQKSHVSFSGESSVRVAVEKSQPLLI